MKQGSRHGVYTVGSSARGDKTKRRLIPIPNTTDVSPDFVTMVEMFRRNGYVCGHTGKWHLGDDEDGNGPLSQGFIFNFAGSRAVRSGDWKLIHFYEDNHMELYNLKEDISEEYNLVEKEPAVVRKLYRKMSHWLKETSSPVPTGLNPDYISQ